MRGALGSHDGVDVRILNVKGGCRGAALPVFGPALDTSRAREAFGSWAAASFKDGLPATIDWYANNSRAQ